MQEFLKDTGRLMPGGCSFGEQLYLMPEHMPATRRLRVLRPACIWAQLKEPAGTAHTHWRLQFLRREACHSWNLSVDEATRVSGWADVSGRRGERAGI
ncbi:MAG: hypothetical protein ACLTC8_02080 [Lachnospiraceae bacterium]